LTSGRQRPKSWVPHSPPKEALVAFVLVFIPPADAVAQPLTERELAVTKVREFAQREAPSRFAGVYLDRAAAVLTAASTNSDPAREAALRAVVGDEAVRIVEVTHPLRALERVRQAISTDLRPLETTLGIDLHTVGTDLPANAGSVGVERCSARWRTYYSGSRADAVRDHPPTDGHQQPDAHHRQRRSGDPRAPGSRQRIGSMPSRAGDSGGPIFFGNTAMGVMSGAVTYSDGNIDAIYSHIGEVTRAASGSFSGLRVRTCCA